MVPFLVDFFVKFCRNFTFYATLYEIHLVIPLKTKFAVILITY